MFHVKRIKIIKKSTLLECIYFFRDVRLAAAKEWCLWEMSTSKLIPDAKYMDKADNLEFAAAFSRYSNIFTWSCLPARSEPRSF